MNKHCAALELPKVLALLAEETVCKDTYAMALGIMPFTDYHTVSAELDKANDAYVLLKRFGAPSLSGMGTPKSCIRRAAAGATLSMGDLLTVAAVLRGVRALVEWRKHCENIQTSLDFLFESLVPNKTVEETIFTAIHSEEEMDDNASPKLADIRRKIKGAGVKARELLERMVRSQTYQKYLQEAIITLRDGRFVLPVKAEYKGEIKGLVHDTSASGATLFIEPMAIVEANNEIRVLQTKERAEIEQILANLSALCADCADDTCTSYDCMLDIDLYFAKARLADQMRAVRPNLTRDGMLHLRQARHPLIERDKVVPIDIRLGQEFDTLVVTGPNTGGKTVALKTTGLFVLMAMCGLLLPCADGSAVSVFDQVLADIGDEQSIEQSLSTFSAHMTNIISIMERAGSETLVLLDELGAGTDPVEGAALAISILDHLKWAGCKVAATTHYAELKVYALETDRVENACCEFDVASLRPTYKLLIGVPGRSNAFAISQRLGLEGSVIDRARALVSHEKSRFEDVVSGLEQSRQELEREKELATVAREESARANAQIQSHRKQLEQEREKEMERARREAKNVVEHVRYEAGKLMDELTELKKNKDSEEFSRHAAEARAQFNSRVSKLYDMADPVVARKDEHYVLPRPLKEGDSVLLADVEQAGVVVKAIDKDGMVMVQAGILKTKTPLSNLRLLDESQKRKPKPSPRARTVKPVARAQAKTEVDLRGMNMEEALLTLDRFIDECVMSHIDLVTIIHGKGTGVLRKGIQVHLKSHPNIDTYRLGVYGEGEDGVTIATLQ
ncbi:MAG: endonuclease MutS2 [Acetanaerobacterium sp.]